MPLCWWKNRAMFECKSRFYGIRNVSVKYMQKKKNAIDLFTAKWVVMAVNSPIPRDCTYGCRYFIQVNVCTHIHSLYHIYIICLLCGRLFKLKNWSQSSSYWRVHKSCKQCRTDGAEMAAIKNQILHFVPQIFTGLPRCQNLIKTRKLHLKFYTFAMTGLLILNKEVKSRFKMS